MIDAFAAQERVGEREKNPFLRGFRSIFYVEMSFEFGKILIIGMERVSGLGVINEVCDGEMCLQRILG